MVRQDDTAMMDVEETTTRSNGDAADGASGALRPATDNNSIATASNTIVGGNSSIVAVMTAPPVPVSSFLGGSDTPEPSSSKRSRRQTKRYTIGDETRTSHTAKKKSRLEQQQQPPPPPPPPPPVGGAGEENGTSPAEVSSEKVDPVKESKTESTKNKDEDGNKKTKKKKKDAKDKVVEDDMNWVCAECKEAECMMEPTAEEFLICDGACHRVFHYPCAGLSKIPDTEEDWICKDCSQSRHPCAFCQEYGQDQVDVFRCRKDKCGLFFHESCLALNNVPVKMEEQVVVVVVPDSNRGGDVPDAPSADGLTQTPALASSPRSVEAGPIGGDNVATSVPVFTCPAHHCWTCTQDDARKKEKEDAAAVAAANTKAGGGGKKKKRGGSKQKQSSIFQCKTESRTYRCLYCPWAYHLTCLPPTSKFHELGVLCPDHSLTHKLPDLDFSTSLQGTVEEKIEQKLEKLSGQNRARKRLLLHGFEGRGGASSNPFFPGMRGDRLVTEEKLYMDYLTKVKENEDDNDHHDQGKKDGFDLTTAAVMSAFSTGGLSFCLPVDIKNEVHSKPPNYTHLHRLRYDPNRRPKKIPPTGEQCQCVDSCGDHCFNRMTLMECSGEGVNSNCRLGADKCGNRSMGKRQFVKCKPQRESGKGWGLVPMEDVPKGKLVQEYVGEVIDEAGKEHRLIEWSKEHPNDPNFYVMGLGSGWYVDAREFANMSRFINHSCDPNCQVTTINVKGYKRNGIFALRDIKAGEFLCYDYHFDTKQADKFLCRCGAKNCRGTMQGAMGGSGDANKKPLNWKDAKTRYENDIKQLAELNKKQVISQVGALIPAAEQPTEFVSSGPPEKHRDTAVRNGIFLWRNAKRGSDFVARNSRIETVSSEKNNNTHVSNTPPIPVNEEKAPIE